APHRRAGGERGGRDAPRLAAAGDVDDVDLRHLVVLAPRREGDLPAVGAPGGPALRRFVGGQPPRRGAAVGGDDPEVGDLLFLVVGGLGHGNDDPLAVGRDGGRADPLHQEEGLVGEGLLRRRGLGDRGGGGGGEGGENHGQKTGSDHGPSCYPTGARVGIGAILRARTR